MTWPNDYAAGEELPAAELNKIKKSCVINDVTAGETISGATLPVAVFMNNTDDEWYACDANDQTKLEFQGLAISDGSDGNAMDVVVEGVVDGFSGLTVGAQYYVQDDKTLGTTVGTYEIYVGIAISATQILIDKGCRAGMQFMGTASITGSDGGGSHTSWTGTGTTLAAARLIIVTFAIAADPNSVKGDAMMTRVGKNTTSIQRDHVGAASSATVSLTWNPATETVSLSISSGAQNSAWSGSGTIYMYR